MDLPTLQLPAYSLQDNIINSPLRLMPSFSTHDPQHKSVAAKCETSIFLSMKNKRHSGAFEQTNLIPNPSISRYPTRPPSIRASQQPTAIKIVVVRDIPRQKRPQVRIRVFPVKSSGSLC